MGYRHLGAGSAPSFSRCYLTSSLVHGPKEYFVDKKLAADFLQWPIVRNHLSAGGHDEIARYIYYDEGNIQAKMSAELVSKLTSFFNTVPPDKLGLSGKGAAYEPEAVAKHFADVINVCQYIPVGTYFSNAGRKAAEGEDVKEREKVGSSFYIHLVSMHDPKWKDIVVVRISLHNSTQGLKDSFGGVDYDLGARYDVVHDPSTGHKLDMKLSSPYFIDLATDVNVLSAHLRIRNKMYQQKNYPAKATPITKDDIKLALDLYERAVDASTKSFATMLYVQREAINAIVCALYCTVEVVNAVDRSTFSLPPIDVGNYDFSSPHISDPDAFIKGRKISDVARSVADLFLAQGGISAARHPGLDAKLGVPLYNNMVSVFHRLAARLYQASMASNAAAQQMRDALEATILFTEAEGVYTVSAKDLVHAYDSTFKRIPELFKGLRVALLSIDEGLSDAFNSHNSRNLRKFVPYQKWWFAHMGSPMYDDSLALTTDLEDLLNKGMKDASKTAAAILRELRNRK